VPRKSSSEANASVQAVIVKKCDRTFHRPESNKGCANGTCQHTCEPAQVEQCPHKWTVRYSVNSRQREQSFPTLAEAQTFQLTLSTGKRTEGAMFTDPRAGIVEFLPLCDAYIEGMAKANAKSKDTYRSNFANPAVTRLLQGKSVLEVARMDGRGKDPPEQDPRPLQRRLPGQHPSHHQGHPWDLRVTRPQEPPSEKKYR
jgi:hypothetical protein